MVRLTHLPSVHVPAGQGVNGEGFIQWPGQLPVWDAHTCAADPDVVLAQGSLPYVSVDHKVSATLPMVSVSVWQ